MANPRDVKVDSTPYAREHGAQPRGAGNWAFCPRVAYQSKTGNYLDSVLWSSGPFGEAKADARVVFASRGVVDVVVCP
jgi:hypothetical protein